ncbi:MAG: AAA family ATPase [Agathobacter sp.]|nr:AAA family ATPase [Agathobacter sp.]
MRYYEFAIGGVTEKIKELIKEKEYLRDYRWSDTVYTINNYMYQNLKNNLGFLAYRQESDEKLLAILFFDERKETLDNAYDCIIDELEHVFEIKRIQLKPCEITMYQFMDCFKEAKRRGFDVAGSKIVELSNLFIYDYCADNSKAYHFDFTEKIISETMTEKRAIYDEDFIEELSNIKTHSNNSVYKGNMVHYIISSRSIEAACDMAETLVQCLAKANRISGRRMEVISEIEPDIYKSNSYIEEIIENNYGGVIVFDLSEKFGYSSVDYQMTCGYIEKLVKKYKNECLFVFTYNMEKPGFSYYLLPNLKKYIIPVMLKEGTGDRKSAINYMKSLIESSEYSKYAKQADEFIKQFPQEKFTQTDVLEAYEQFEAWCLNKNILHAYDYNISGDFMLDRDENKESSQKKLNQMIGLESVKTQIKKIIATDIVEKERKRRRGNAYKSGTMHMIFGGNPGSAKTTVAKLFAGIAKEEGILKSGAFVECGGMDLDGFGCVYVIREAFMAAKGGVLFIDEAYSMRSDTAVTVLIQEMEEHREDVIVILAGYNERMQAFMKINEGLKSRIPYWIDFPDYSADELTDILKMMINERGFSIEEDAVKEANYIFEKVCHVDNFGNGRYVRNLIEHALQKQSVRLLTSRGSVDKIHKKELFSIIKDDICMFEEASITQKEIGNAKKELHDMVGLSKTKAVIEKAISSFKLRKLCMERGIEKDKASLHMVFTGNPGTAKTTVARLFAEILKDEKVLSTGNFVEVGRADLVGDHVGATAPLVKQKFKEAQGGILFIDEAYSLCDGYENGFGDEAINTIVQEMENHRDNVIVIFAGYPDKMKHFLDKNPGLISRIAFQVEFEDYDTEELCEITKLMLNKKQMRITNQAMKKLTLIYDSVKESNDFGNGRFVRKTIEEAEMNLAERLLKGDESKITEEVLTLIEEEDIPDVEIYGKQEVKRIGFCA